MNMATQNLLVELFVEELPPKALKKLGEAFAGQLAQQLQTLGLASAESVVTPYASPRRLGAHVTHVADKAADKAVQQKLMPVSVGLDASGAATPALVKKLQGLGADISDLAKTVASLRRAIDGKAEALFYDSQVSGVTLATGLQQALDVALAQLPIPKVMSYQLHTDCDMPGWSSVNFVRPAHGLVAIHGSNLVPVKALGLTAGHLTHGHRFEAAVDPVVLTHADSYAATLAKDGAVIASFAERRAEIVRQLAAAAAQIGGGCQSIEDEAMKANQKYFPLLDATGRLTHQFLVVSNINPADASAVIGGNERVVRPRLADAKFFFDQDRKRSLESRVAGLDKVVYHNKLGTQGERMARVCLIAYTLGMQLEGTALAERAELAARLAKTDLLTDMVGEFPELQGIMGGYYARHDGLGDDIADAIEDHYKPRFAGDSLPRNAVGVVVALADKLETLVGMFGIGNLPTGDKDPFALRRHALGVIRMLIEKDLPLDLSAMVAAATPAFGDKIVDATAALTDFVFDRLAGSLREQGFSALEVDAVQALRPQRLGDIPRRLTAVRAFAALPEAPALAAANKRISNILKKADAVAASVRPELLVEPAEAALFAAMGGVLPAAQGQLDAMDYTAALQTLAALRAPVDAFFEGVMVNAEAPELRANRLGLLKTLHTAMNQVADLARLAA